MLLMLMMAVLPQTPLLIVIGIKTNPVSVEKQML